MKKLAVLAAGGLFKKWDRRNSTLTCKNKTIITKLIKYVSRLPEINNLFNKKVKKIYSFKGAAPNSPDSLQASDLGLKLVTLQT